MIQIENGKVTMTPDDKFVPTVDLNKVYFKFGNHKISFCPFVSLSLFVIEQPTNCFSVGIRFEKTDESGDELLNVEKIEMDECIDNDIIPDLVYDELCKYELMEDGLAEYLLNFLKKVDIQYLSNPAAPQDCWIIALVIYGLDPLESETIPVNRLTPFISIEEM